MGKSLAFVGFGRDNIEAYPQRLKENTYPLTPEPGERISIYGATRRLIFRANFVYL